MDKEKLQKIKYLIYIIVGFFQFLFGLHIILLSRHLIIFLFIGLILTYIFSFCLGLIAELFVGVNRYIKKERSTKIIILKEFSIILIVLNAPLGFFLLIDIFIPNFIPSRLGIPNRDLGMRSTFNGVLMLYLFSIVLVVIAGYLLHSRIIKKKKLIQSTH